MLPLIVGLCAVVVFTFARYDPITQGVVGLFLMNNVLLALLLAPRAGLVLAGLLLAVCVVLLYALDWPITREYSAPWLLQPAAVGFGFGWALRRSLLARLEADRLAERLGRMNEVLAENLRHSQALAAGRERNRIAQALHDRLGHCLTTTHVYLQVAQRHASAETPLAQALGNAAAMTKHGLMELRSCVVLLRDPEPDRPLAESIREIVERIPPSVLRAEFRTSGPARRLEPGETFALLRTAQEGLTNVLRHARAHRVVVELRFGPGRVELSVSDDGVGCAEPRFGIGLTGIRERLQAIGGALVLEPRPGAGYRLHASIG